MYTYIVIYIYIYIYITPGKVSRPTKNIEPPENDLCVVLGVVVSVKEHHDLQFGSPLLKKTCVRHVVLHKWFPLNQGTCIVLLGTLNQT